MSADTGTVLCSICETKRVKVRLDRNTLLNYACDDCGAEVRARGPLRRPVGSRLLDLAPIAERRSRSCTQRGGLPPERGR